LNDFETTFATLCRMMGQQEWNKRRMMTTV